MTLLMMLMTATTAWATITGSGTSTDPYVINSEDDWNTAATNNAYWYNGVYVELGSNLNFSEKTFNVYGGYASYYNLSKLNLHFDGRGHTISGVSIGDLSSENCAALFGKLNSGTITGITLANSSFKAKLNAAGIVCVNNGTVSDCHVLSSVTLEVKQKRCAGIAVESKGIVTGCTVAAVFKLPVQIYNDNDMAGIVGLNRSTITDCLFYGTVVTDGNDKTLFGCIAEKYFSGTTYSGNCYRPVAYSEGTYTAFKTGDGNANATIVHIAIGGIPTGATVSPAAPYSYAGSYWSPSGTTVTITPGENTAFKTFSVSGATSSSFAADRRSATIALGTADVTVSATLQAIGGSCGDNATWSLAQNGSGNYTILTISGTGAMQDYGHDNSSVWRTTAPWGYDLTSATIGDGITTIGKFAFCGCQQLSSITIGNSVTTIGDASINHCDALTELILPASVATIGYAAFENCQALTTIYFNNTGAISLTGNINNHFNAPKLQRIVFSTLEGALANTTGYWTQYAEKCCVQFGGQFFHATNEGGTAAYQIANATDWNNLATAVNAGNNGSGQTFRQTADITVSNFTPIGNSETKSFRGTYDGGSKKLTATSNAVSSNYVAPFGYLYGTAAAHASVKDLSVVTTITAADYKHIAGLIALHSGYVDVTNCNAQVTLSATKGSQQTELYPAGIVSQSNGTLSIERCTATGTISTDGKYAGGLVGIVQGTATITDCVSSVTINSSTSGDGTHGGFVAVVSGSGTITGCVFNGKLLTTNGTNNCAGFIAWGNGTITNCLYAPATIGTDETEVMTGDVNYNPSGTFYRGTAPSVSNCYYTRTLGTAQGKAPHTVSGGERVTVSDIALTGTTTAYTTSGITAYSGGGLSYNDNIICGSSDPVSLTLGNTLNEGYQFNGYVASAGELSGNDTDGYTLTMPDGDVTINAAWTPITYHITYHPNGGEFTTDKNTFTIESETITLDVPTRKGYTFGGWYNNSGLTGDAVTTIAAGSHADVELWAKWTIINYTITYNLDGGMVATANPTTYNVETETFTLNNPTKPGYTFTGWTLDDNNTLLTTVTIEKGSIDHRTYTAHFEIIHFTQGDLSYECTSGTEVKVTACNSSATNVTIPATVTDSEVTYSVTAIDAAAFSGCTALTSITIPASVTSIGNMSFKDCSGLESITVATGNGTYDSRNACNAIIETVSNKLILGCKTTVIPHGVKVIGDHAFRSCTGLTNISIPTSVTSIDKAAFYGCTGLTTVIMQAITPPTLGDYVFEGCQALSAIGVPAGTASAYSSATNWSAYAYKIFTIDGTSGDGVYWSYNSTSKTMTIFGTGAMSNYSWGDRPWYNFRSDITTVDIRAGVTSIGESAFESCAYLTTVIIRRVESPITQLGIDALDYCSALTGIYVPKDKVNDYKTDDNWSTYADKIQVYDTCCDGVYWLYNSNDNTLIISGTGEMPNFSNGNQPWYSYCNDITKVDIRDGVTSISNWAFDGCTGLTTVMVQRGETTITELGYDVFDDCDDDLIIYVPNDKVDVYKEADNWKDYAEKIQGYGTCGDAVYWSYNSTSKTLTIFGTGAMSNYSWGDCPWFNFRSDITTVDIRAGVTSIGEYAFDNCPFLTSINIPANVTSIGHRAFSYCVSLESISVVESNTTYDSRNGCNALIETNTNTLILGCCNTIIPNTVTSIGECAFNNCSSLTSITIPNSVTDIGDYAFNNCSSLTSINIPASVTSIGECAFCDCDGLSSITIPNSVTTIGNDAFYDCGGLSSITIPNSVTDIGNYAFDWCTDLTTVFMQATTPPTLGSYAFDDCDDELIIYVPAGTAATYMKAPGWQNYAEIIKEIDGVSLVNIAMNTDGIMTYASAYDLDFSAVSGLTAYVATGISEGTLTLTRVEKVPAGTGLLLKGEAGKTFTVPSTGSATAVGNNLLVGLTEETDVNRTTADGIAFILAHGNHGINWYRLAENSYTLKANSAYLRLSASEAPSASRTLTMVFEDVTTGVRSNTASSLNGGEWYDLNGRKLSKKPTRKGLYIFNGRKTLIK